MSKYGGKEETNLQSNYSDLHSHKNVWSYSEVSNVGMFFEDFKDQLSESNVAMAKNMLKKCLYSFYFEPITLHFGKAQLIIDNVDDAATTFDEIVKAEYRHLKSKK